MTRRLTGEQPEIDAATEDGTRDDFWWPVATLPTAADGSEAQHPADSRAAGKLGCTARV
ncbi:hypothetical protein [Streptomyces sp. BPTC-684]|uniref:hypothetical protein n=1 Tax=Streptomyces sp. BPTC-684 TaxID=3043734 RepID=UPI0024B215CA|nr:hypothetical protein [Streptomyces sp. BPTC-684]WHM40397.1 hypothetical protein QIY60_28410 [Streptomyces sp. BPTC-684]